MKLNDIAIGSVWHWRHLPNEGRRVVNTLIFSHGEYILYEEIINGNACDLKLCSLKSWNNASKAIGNYLSNLVLCENSRQIP